MTLKFSKVEKSLLKTGVKADNIYDEDSSELKLPKLFENLQMDSNYYSKLEFDPSTGEAENFPEWKIVDLVNNGKILRTSDDTVYISERNVSVSGEVKVDAFLNLENKLSWNKPNLTKADVIGITRQITNTILGQIGLNLNNSKFTYEIIPDPNMLNNNLAVALFSSTYFLIVNYIAKGRCEIGEEYIQLKRNLDHLDAWFGNYMTKENTIINEVRQFQKVYCTLFEYVLESFLYKYIDLRIARVSEVNIDGLEEDFMKLYEESKILIGNVCGGELELEQYYMLNDVISYVMVNEENWIKLLKVACRNNYYENYMRDYLEKIKKSNLDIYMISILDKSIEYLNDREKYKNIWISNMTNSYNSTNNSEKTKRLSEVKKSMEAIDIQFNSFFDEVEEQINSGGQLKSNIEYRLLNKSDFYSKTRKLFIKNESGIVGKNELHKKAFNLVGVLPQMYMAEVDTSVFDLNLELGLEGEYLLQVNTVNLDCYNKIVGKFYVGINNKGEQYIRYVELSLEEPVIDPYESKAPSLTWGK